MTTNEDVHGQVHVCTPRYLPEHLVAQADERACAIRPDNRPTHGAMVAAVGDPGDRLSVLRRAYWGRSGVRLTVGFLDRPPADLRARILSHMNAWSETAQIELVETSTDPQVRIARLDAPAAVAGYWSYLGTDILSIAKDAPTMNLQGFTMKTPDAEFFRVVRHETGHTLGFPHEHMRAALIARLNHEKVIAEFMRTQRWSRRQVREQLLTPLEESSLLGSTRADGNSIMCYQIAAHLTTDGVAITGGTDLDRIDREMVAKFYPRVR